jgi:hypothetical protein
LPIEFGDGTDHPDTVFKLAAWKTKSIHRDATSLSLLVNDNDILRLLSIVTVEGRSLGNGEALRRSISCVSDGGSPLALRQQDSHLNVQNVQTQKSYELDLWNTCADHEAMQNTTTCRRVLSQTFDRFQKRGLKDLDPEIASRIRETINNRNALDGRLLAILVIFMACLLMTVS